MHEIRYSESFNKDFLKLKLKAEKGNSEAVYLISLIEKATDKLSEDKEAGKKIPRKLWPKEFIQKYGLTNFWKFNLDSYWRMLYTITGDEIDLFLIYLEYLNHKEYNRKFKH